MARAKKKSKKRQKKRRKKRQWDPFEKGYLAPEEQHMTGMADVWMNNLYQVYVRKIQTAIGEMTHLSIKKLNREVVRDWRDLQRIKNELLGPEIEAVEIFPAESRLVDTSNQYHLWALTEEGMRFPFGYDARVVSEASIGESKQRPFEEKPPDLIGQKEADQMVEDHRNRGRR